MITISSIEERLEHYRRMELAGIRQPEPYFGPMALLWIEYHDGRETWEIYPEWLAELVLSELSYQGAARAILYRRLPLCAPDDVARRWLEVKRAKAKV